MSMWNELKRRNVFRVAAAYLVAAWLIVQVADVAADGFGFPGWFMPMLFVVLGLGFPVALVFSWAFEITPEGVKRERDVKRDSSMTTRTGRRLDLLTVGAVILAVIVLGVDRFWLADWMTPDSAVRADRSVQAEDTGTEEASPADAGQETARNSIAVLPFADMSPEGDQEYFSDGLSEEILNLLAQIRELKVIGRTSSFAFKGRNVDLREIGDQLGASYLLEGSVRKAGDQLRITAQLIEAEEGTHLWSETYDRQLENIFQIQDEIADSIVDALSVSLTSGERLASAESGTDSMPAYDRFLEARRLIRQRDPDGLVLASRLLDEALELDPEFAQALAARAQAVLLLTDSVNTYGNVPMSESVPRADELLDRALEVNAQLGSAYAVRGLRYLITRDLDSASSALSRALDINPSDVDALTWQMNALGSNGRNDAWIEVAHRALDIDPLNRVVRSNLARAYLLAGRRQDALDIAVRLRTDFPEIPSGYLREAQALMALGQLSKALPVADRALELAPGSEQVQHTVGDTRFRVGQYEKVLSLSRASQATSLVALDREEDAVARARERLNEMPGAYIRLGDLFRVLSLAGRHEAVLSLYDDRFGTWEALEEWFAADLMAWEVKPVAVAMSAENRADALAVMLASWRERLDRLREQGNANGEILLNEAVHASLSGASDVAIDKLALAIDSGYRNPLLARDLAFSNLADLPAFRAQVERMMELINAERLKLDLEPLT